SRSRLRSRPRTPSRGVPPGTGRRGRWPRRPSWVLARRRDPDRAPAGACLARCFLGPREAVLVQAADEHAACDAEALGGAGLVAAAGLERLDDAAALGLRGVIELAACAARAGRRARARAGRR